jgi:hypothetical protein
MGDERDGGGDCNSAGLPLLPATVTLMSMAQVFVSCIGGRVGGDDRQTHHPQTTITSFFTLSRIRIQQSNRQESESRVLENRECPSVTSRPVINLSVVPSSSPEGIPGKP